MGRAKSYAERLFEFVPINPLDDKAARAALAVPAEKEGVAFAPEAIAEILRHTMGYPYFLQEWGRHAWNAADASPISRADARRATTLALAELDAGFFRVRFDRLTPTEKRYLRAMAELGPGPHRSGDIAEQLGKGVTNVAPIRNGLIAKGMIYSPAHGDTAFTVPLFLRLHEKNYAGAAPMTCRRSPKCDTHLACLSGMRPIRPTRPLEHRPSL
jgi:hypothetical protein